MDEKVVVADDKHVERSDSTVGDLTASGFAKKGEKEIKARNAEFAAAIGENKPDPVSTVTTKYTVHEEILTMNVLVG